MSIVEPPPRHAEALALLENDRQIWACDPATLDSYIRALRSGTVPDVSAASSRRAGQGDLAPGGVAVLGLRGFIGYRPSLLTELFGTSLQTWVRTFDSLVAAKNVRAIVLDVSSGGGEASGVPEIAERIREARKEKRIVAFTDFCGSAAYWLTSATSRVYALGSGSLGSIGVYVRRLDITSANRQAGVNVRYISSTPQKTENLPDVPSTEGERKYLQGVVNEIHASFIADVARNRGVSVQRAAQWGTGRVYMAKRALAIGLADELVDGLDELVDRVTAVDRDRRLRGYERAAAGISDAEWSAAGKQIKVDRLREKNEWRVEAAARNRKLAAWEAKLPAATPDAPEPTPAQPAADRYEAIATKMIRAARIKTVTFRPEGTRDGKNLKGRAWPKERKIEVPQPTDPDRLVTLAHEVAHVVLGHSDGTPRWREEFEASVYAEKEMSFHAVEIPAATAAADREYVAREIDKAVAKPGADIDAEALAWCGDALTARTRAWMRSKGRELK